MNLIIVFSNNMSFFIIIQSEHIFRCLLIFLNDFLSILIQFLTSNDWDARITICLCPDCRRACLGAQFRFVYCPFITVDQLFSIVFICLKGILLSNYLSSPVYLEYWGTVFLAFLLSLVVIHSSFQMFLLYNHFLFFSFCNLSFLFHSF